jgi:hypothetical protein
MGARFRVGFALCGSLLGGWLVACGEGPRGADLLGQATLGRPNACAQLELTTVLLGPTEAIWQMPLEA